MPKKKVNFDLVPLVQRKADELIALAAAKGMSIRINEGYRSIARQNELYAQGRTTPGVIVTKAKGGESFHNYGVAFDVCFQGKVPYPEDEKLWEKLGKLGSSLGLNWGGPLGPDDTFTFDSPHFEMLLNYKLKDFQQNKIDWTKFA